MTARFPATNLREHPATRAWTKLQSKSITPAAIVRLQRKDKCCVYRLEGLGPGGSDIIAKQSSPERIRAERTIYEQVLPALPVPGVRYYGFVEEPEDRCCWLFVENAGGDEYSPLLEEHRALAARWLGLLHASASRLAAAAACLPDRGPDYYQQHLRSALDTIPRRLGHPALTAEDRALLRAVVRQCEIVGSHWDQVETLCAQIPRTFIHGDFAPKNMRVRTGLAGKVLLPFDWASAGWGPPAADLVQSAQPSGGEALDLAAYWASPDLAAYGSAVRETWPHLDLEDLRSLAIVGKLFRCLICIDLDAQGLGSAWVEKSVRHMRLYETEMADAIQAAGWKG